MKITAANKASRQEARMVEANLGLVRQCAHRHAKNSWLPYEELYQAGCIGLLNAVRRYDPARGNKFSSYAVPLINGEILHAIRDTHEQGLKVPRQDREQMQSIRKLHRELVRQRPDLTLEEVAIAYLEQRGLPPIRATQRWQEISASCAKKSFEELPEIAGTDSDRPNTAQSLLARLPWPTGTILLFHHSGLSNEAIAKRYNLKPARVAEIVEEATRRLKASAA